METIHNIIDFIRDKYVWWLIISLLVYWYGIVVARRKLPRLPENDQRTIYFSRPVSVLFNNEYGRIHLVWSIIIGTIFFFLASIGIIHRFFS